jgi:hypothetical protein
MYATQVGNVVGKFVHGPICDTVRPTLYMAFLGGVVGRCRLTLLYAAQDETAWN